MGTAAVHLMAVVVVGLIVAGSWMLPAAGGGSGGHRRRRQRQHRPPQGPSSFTFYVHNRVYDPAVNNSGFTSVYSEGPEELRQANPFGFGVRSTFEAPITSGPRSNGSVGVARGAWFLDSRSRFVLMHVFTASITSPPHVGTLAIVGQLDEAADTRVLAVVGGTGAFLAARGVAFNRLVALDHGPPATWTLSFHLHLYY